MNLKLGISLHSRKILKEGLKLLLRTGSRFSTKTKTLDFNKNTEMESLRTVITPPTGRHSATVIFLHGSGNTGEGLKDGVDEMSPNGNRVFQFPHIKIIYPTAPVRRYTLMFGMPSTVWFDRRTMDINGWEDQSSALEISKCLDEIISQEIAQHSIDPRRIIIGGHSMGGAMSMQYGYGVRSDTYPFPAGSCPAGVFVLSSFLHNTSRVYWSLKENPDLSYPTLYQAHGALDDLVHRAWAETTNKNLQELGVKCYRHGTVSKDGMTCGAGGSTTCDMSCSGLRVYKDMEHDIAEEEIKDLYDWILSVLPEI